MRAPLLSPVQTGAIVRVAMSSPDVSPLVGRLLVAAVIALGVVLFGVSLAFDAARFEVVDKSSFEMLTIGWMGPLGMHFGWYANLVLPLPWIFSLVLRRWAAVVAIASSLVCLVIGLSSFYTLSAFSVIGRNEGEMAGDLVSFAPGIYLWTGSLMTGLLAGVASLALAQLSAKPE